MDAIHAREVGDEVGVCITGDGAEHEVVGPVAAGECVVARAAGYRIVTGIAVEVFRTGPADEQVSAVAADNSFDVYEIRGPGPVVSAARDDARGEIRGDRGRHVPEVERIVARAAIDRVDTRCSGEGILREHVVVGAADKAVVAVVAVNRVGASAADNRVVAGAAPQQVRAGIAGDQVIQRIAVAVVRTPDESQIFDSVG